MGTHKRPTGNSYVACCPATTKKREACEETPRASARGAMPSCISPIMWAFVRKVLCILAYILGGILKQTASPAYT